MTKDESPKTPSEFESEVSVKPIRVKLSRNKSVKNVLKKLPASYGRRDLEPGPIGPFRPIKEKGKPTNIKRPNHDDD